MAIRNAISEDFLPPSKPLDSTQGRISHLEPPSSCRIELRWTLYDKKKFIFIDGKALSESPNFPWYDSKLTERSKVGVVTSEMVRYSRRTDTETDFIAHTMALIKKMVKFGYEKRKVMRKVQNFRHFPRNLGRWSRTRRRIMDTFNDWYNAINAEHR